MRTSIFAAVALIIGLWSPAAPARAQAEPSAAQPKATALGQQALAKLQERADALRRDEREVRYRLAELETEASELQDRLARIRTERQSVEARREETRRTLHIPAEPAGATSGRDDRAGSPPADRLDRVLRRLEAIERRLDAVEKAAAGKGGER